MKKRREVTAWMSQGSKASLPYGNVDAPSAIMCVWLRFYSLKKMTKVMQKVRMHIK